MLNKANGKCLDLIKKWEGYHTELPNGNARAYKCPAGVWTIGFGSTRNLDTNMPVREGEVITRETAERWLRKEADQCWEVMANRYPQCNENQLAALTSLTFNIGVNGIGDGLNGLLLAGEWSLAAERILAYNKADGRVLEGLTNRRKEERMLFLTPVASSIVDLPVPFYPQLDNPRFPGGTCNVTSVAMVLAFFGVKPERAGEQLEMEVLRKLEARGYDRHVHDHLSNVMKKDYGLKNHFTTTAKVADIKAHLNAGNPVIMSGYFTRSGHIIVIRGYDEAKQKFIVNDPYGEYFANGYAKEPVATRGRRQLYSYSLIKRVCGGDGKIWCHFPSKVSVS